MISLKTPDQVARIRESCVVVAETLEALRRIVESGIATSELDRWAVDFIKSRGGVPAFKGYRGYPASTCVSVNNEVVHGIPGDRTLADGDIVSIDVGVKKGGYFGDGAATFGVGDISEDAQRLLDVTELALMKGIEQAIAGHHLGDISHAIQTCAESLGFSVVRELVGHGIGLQMHEDPHVPNYGNASCGPLLVEGMVLAIEPMVTAGSWEVETLGDNWTVVTKDGSLAAHFEHTVAVCDDGAEILTQPGTRALGRSKS